MNKAVIFDFDGVIINSIGVQQEAFCESYKMLVNDKVPPFDEFLKHSGDSLSNILKKMNLPLSMIEPFIKISEDKIDCIKLYNGMDVLLSELKREGYRCGLCTGKDRNRTIEILKRLKLIDYFDTIVCSDDVEHPKPHSESLILAMTNLNINHEDCVMVGDSNNDILCAYNAKVKSIAVTWGHTKKDNFKTELTDYVVDSVFELKKSIERFLSNKKIKKTYIVNDFIVAEHNCNMNCMYCLTDISEFKEIHRTKHRKKVNIIKYQDGEILKEKIDNISNIIDDNFDIPILKISGGELLLVKDIVEYIKSQSQKYKVIQILSNGLLINKKMLEELKKLNNICFQVSLDHHTLQGNIYRTDDKRVLNKILENINEIVSYDIPLEINCVLTDKNTLLITEFAEELLKYDGKVMLYPFPVRGSNRDLFYPKVEHFSGIEKLIDSYPRYKNILPPKIYLDSLLKFLINGEREVRCVVAGMTIGTFDDGMVTPCPNYWFKNIGNLLDNTKEETLKKVGKSKIYRALMKKNNKIKECAKCFTPWEVLNLYFSDEMTIEDLCKCPVYGMPGVKDYIVYLKNSIKKELNDL